jgi:hypothetical protein
VGLGLGDHHMLLRRRRLHKFHVLLIASTSHTPSTYPTAHCSVGLFRLLRLPIHIDPLDENTIHISSALAHSSSSWVVTSI